LLEGNERHLQGAVSSFGCQENTVPAAASAVAGGARGIAATKVSQNYAIYAIYVARQQRFLAGTRTHRVNQKTHLAPVASLCCCLLRVAYNSPSSYVVACLIFGNINLLTTYAS